MSRDTYVQCFLRAFDIDDPAKVETLTFEGIPEWDSIGHMALISELEDELKITIALDDVIALSSFETGLKILEEKYGMEIV